jgi:hypothetical protein
MQRGLYRTARRREIIEKPAQITCIQTKPRHTAHSLSSDERDLEKGQQSAVAASNGLVLREKGPWVPFREAGKRELLASWSLR